MFKSQLSILVLISLLSGCGFSKWNGTGDKRFILLLDWATSQNWPLVEVQKVLKDSKIARSEDVINEIDSEDKKTEILFYKTPGNLSNGNEPYNKLFCLYHLIIKPESTVVIGWGFDMPEGKIRRAVCRG